MGRPATAFPWAPAPQGCLAWLASVGQSQGGHTSPRQVTVAPGAGPGPGCDLPLACPCAWQDTGCSLLLPQPTVSPRRAQEGCRRDSSGRAGGTPWRPQRAALRLSMEPEPLLEAPLHPTRSWALPAVSLVGVRQAALGPVRVGRPFGTGPTGRHTHGHRTQDGPGQEPRPLGVAHREVGVETVPDWTPRSP